MCPKDAIGDHAEEDEDHARENRSVGEVPGAEREAGRVRHDIADDGPTDDREARHREVGEVTLPFYHQGTIFLEKEPRMSSLSPVPMGHRLGAMPTDPLLRDIAGIAALDEPVRRALYTYVAGQADPVGRDAAALAAGTTRENAAFHLDKLVTEGLLEASFKRLSGRSGPGAGRPAKLYRRSARQLDVSVPARRYGLLAEVLADAIECSRGTDPRREISTAARAFGADLGTSARERAGVRRGRATMLRAALEVLDEHGFEPIERPRGTVRLRNCPFDALAKRHPDLVCAMNLSLVEGLVAGLDATGLAARLDPQPGRCCVTLGPPR